MGWNPSFATGANASVVAPPGSENPHIPSSEGLAVINPREKKDRRWAQDIPGVNKVAPGQGWFWSALTAGKHSYRTYRPRMGAQTASQRISGSCKARKEKSKGR